MELVSNDGASTTITVTVPKSPKLAKHRINSHNQSIKRNRSESNRISTATNKISSKLPDLVPKANFYSSTLDNLSSKRKISQQKDLFSSSSKLERQTTNTNAQSRFPVLYSLTDDNDQKRIVDLRRRQIYALNHLMRELEQEQFRQFCKLNGLGIHKSETNTMSNDTTKT